MNKPKYLLFLRPIYNKEGSAGGIAIKKITLCSIPFIAACLMLGILFYLVGASSQATAAPSQPTPDGTILVTTLEDELNTDGDCSLREAIKAANDNITVDACPAGDSVITDTVTFDVMGTLTVSSQLEATAGGPLVIDGADVITTSGGGTTRVWSVNPGSELTLQHLAVVNGLANDFGAGLYNNGASVIIRGDEFRNNRFEFNENGCMGGAIYSHEGTLTVEDSLFLNNGLDRELMNGGGIAAQFGIVKIQHSIFMGNESLGYWYEDEEPGGGALWLGGTLVTVEESSFIDNNGGHGGGAIANGGTLTITNSTLSGNDALGLGGKGGAIDNKNYSLLTIINSTFSNNHSWVGGGISNYTGKIYIIYSTFSGNCADLGGGINNFDLGNVYLSNTIVANNPSGNDCSGEITDSGHNLDSDGTCGLDQANGSLPNTDPKLGPLQENGGPTWTNALFWNSPAIDTADDTQCPPTDQRGVIRPIDGNGDGIAVCDIGSFELEGPLYPLFLPLVAKIP